MTLNSNYNILPLIIIEGENIMSLYGDKQDYANIVNSNIQKAKLLYSLSTKDRIIIEKLLIEKEKIKKENGILANLQLKKIDNKIKKIKQKNKNS